MAGGNANKDSIAPPKNASSVCANAYYPASESLRRNYKTTFAGNRIAPSTYTESFKNFTADGYTYQMTFAPREMGKEKSQPLVVQGGIKCSPQGLTMMEYANLQMGNEMQMRVKTIKAEGITFPHESEWKVGKKWSMKYDVEMQFDQAMPPQLKVNPNGTYEMDWEIIGQESVTVPAGTFDALKVNLTFKNNLRMSVGSVSTPINTTFQSNLWVAKNVGMVKTVVPKANAVTELISFEK